MPVCEKEKILYGGKREGGGEGRLLFLKLKEGRMVIMNEYIMIINNTTT